MGVRQNICKQSNMFHFMLKHMNLGECNSTLLCSVPGLQCGLHPVVSFFLWEGEGSDFVWGCISVCWPASLHVSGEGVDNI